MKTLHKKVPFTVLFIWWIEAILVRGSLLGHIKRQLQEKLQLKASYLENYIMMYVAEVGVIFGV